MWNKWRYNCSLALKYHTHFFTSVDLTDVIRWPTWAHSSRWSKRTAFRRTVPFRKEEDGAGRRGCARDDVWRQRGHYVRRSSRRSHIGRPSRPLSIDYRRWVKIFFQKKKKRKENTDVSRATNTILLYSIAHIFFSFSGNKAHPFAHGKGAHPPAAETQNETHTQKLKEKKKIPMRLWCLWKCCRLWCNTKSHTKRCPYIFRETSSPTWCNQVQVFLIFFKSSFILYLCRLPSAMCNDDGIYKQQLKI